MRRLQPQRHTILQGNGEVDEVQIEVVGLPVLELSSNLNLNLFRLLCMHYQPKSLSTDRVTLTLYVFQSLLTMNSSSRLTSPSSRARFSPLPDSCSFP